MLSERVCVCDVCVGSSADGASMLVMSTRNESIIKAAEQKVYEGSKVACEFAFAEREA